MRPLKPARTVQLPLPTIIITGAITLFLVRAVAVVAPISVMYVCLLTVLPTLGIIPHNAPALCFVMTLAVVQSVPTARLIGHVRRGKEYFLRVTKFVLNKCKILQLHPPGRLADNVPRIPFFSHNVIFYRDKT